MRSRYRVVDTESVYFVTSTIVEWLPVFTSAPYFEIITNSLANCRQHKRLRLYAYVILDNHIHLIGGADLPNFPAHVVYCLHIRNEP